MNYIARKKRRQKNNKIYIGIVIAVGLIISIYLLSILKIPLFSKVSSTILYSVDAAFSSVTGVIKDGTGFFGNVKKLNNKIEELEGELEKSKIELQEMEVLKVENNDLKELLKIDEQFNHFDKVYANIITRSYDNWSETFVINKGKSDGIQEKQTVISKDGLVWYISHVEEKTAVVTTILDTSSAVSVEISNINALALVKGDSVLKDKGEIKLVNIPIDTELAVDESVYSSGIGELYKKGIPIGKIIEVISKKNDIDRYAIVDVYSDISSLDMVAVIVN